MKQCFMTFKHKLLTDKKMSEITPIDITVDKIWNLRKYTDNNANEFFANTISNLKKNIDKKKYSKNNNVFPNIYNFKSEY